MRLMILGGGLFIGAAVVDAALARGHTVAVFNRGQSRTRWPAGVEAIVGDRGSDLGRLAGRHWDAVIDSSGYAPAEVRASTAALAATRRYLFVSSVSAYASFAHAPIRETDALADASGVEQHRRDPAVYGAQKVACEAAVAQAFGTRATFVRPGLVVGPGDPTGRFSYWPWRAMAGGPMLVPDVPMTTELQWIDARDLADFMLRLVENDAGGVFNVTGPAPPAPRHWSTLIDACLVAATARGAPLAEPHRVAERVLAAAGVAAWTELPLWLPSDDAAYRGFMRIDISRAVAAGLRTRPIDVTVADIIDEGIPPPDSARRLQPLSRAREAVLLATAATPGAGSPTADSAVADLAERGSTG